MSNPGLLTRVRGGLRPARRRGEYCRNCHYHLTVQANYCPQCGQLNTEQRVAMGTLIQDFVQDYFTFDSKLFRSLGPLLFRPGRLTQAFLAGQRVRYIPPVRLYIFISLIYFFLVSLTFPSGDPESVRVGGSEVGFFNLDILDSISSGLSAEGRGVPADSILEYIEGEMYGVPFRLLKQKDLTTQQVLDSLGWSSTWWNRLRVKQGQKAVQMVRSQDASQFKRAMISNFSLAMFGVMPALGGVLALLYRRRKQSAVPRRYYVEYLVMAVHLQSFFFLLLTFGILLEWLGWANAITWLMWLVPIYCWLALRRVYGQSWRKTTLKAACLLGSVLFIVGFFSLVSTVLSLLTF